MALRIPIPAATLAAGIDSLFVLGVQLERRPSRDTRDALADLLDAHHYTDGLEFLRFGTPTNNTAEPLRLRRDGRDTTRASRSKSRAIRPTLDAKSNAQRSVLRWALHPTRIAARARPRRARRARRTTPMQRSMNTALWQATWGYFLSQHDRRGRHGLDAGGLAWAREHFIAHVRSGGPFPPLRCWPAAVRCPAGHVARPVAAARGRGSCLRAGRVAEEPARQSARQRLAPALGRRRAPGPAAGPARSRRGSCRRHAHRRAVERL